MSETQNESPAPSQDIPQSRHAIGRPRRKVGFALMDPARQREIASLGGKASHRLGKGHEWDSETARIVGRKGAAASVAKRRDRIDQLALGLNARK